MATDTLNDMESSSDNSAPLLEDVAHSQVDELYSVQALLRTIESSVPVGDSLNHQRTHDLMRLIGMANDRIASVVDAFQPYI